MELHSLQSPTLATIPSSLTTPSAFARKAFLHGPQILNFPNFKKYPDATKLKFLDFRPHASGTTKFKSEATAKKVDSKDEDVAFVAGATGKVGSRTIRELLKLGFRVRAGVRSPQKAGQLVESVKQMKFDADIVGEGTQPVEKLEIVECDLEKPDQIGSALGNASVVLCCIGASEKEVFDITGPYRIDYQATKNLIDAATAAKVNHFIMVSSLGTNKIGFPAAILNLFWGVLIWKRKAEEALIASDLPYTIVRPGGMERPTDAYKETHNISLSQEDTLFGGQVSNLQVAELIAFMAKNRNLSYCKVVEVIAETTAPLTPMGELLEKIPAQRRDFSAPKKSDPSAGADPAAPTKTVVPETPSAPTETESAQANAITVESPLSPYATYEDLKPPTSPAPSDPAPSTTPVEKEPAQSKAIATTPLSPYAAYDDLKPPTSPAPTPPSGPKDDASTKEPPLSEPSASDTQTSPSESTTDISEKKPAPIELTITTPLSPYAAYDNFKPPTSPSPAPTKMSLSTSSVTDDGLTKAAAASGNSTPQPPNGEKTSDEKQHMEPKPKPLSPFAMYDELKPPTSPLPSSTMKF